MRRPTLPHHFTVSPEEWAALDEWFLSFARDGLDELGAYRERSRDERMAEAMRGEGGGVVLGEVA